MKKSLLVLISLCSVLASCEMTEIQGVTEKMPIKFAGVKNAGLTEGTTLGLFIGEPVNCSNVKLTVGADGALTSSTALYWGEEQTAQSPVFAYTPYQEGAAETFLFCVEEDQSTKSALQASDFISAFVSADPAKDFISLSLAHRMSRIRLYASSEQGGIAKVEFKDLTTDCIFDATTGDCTLDIYTGSITAYADSDCYVAYFPPQSTELQVVVTLEDGRTAEYVFEAAEFQEGKTYDNEDSPIVVAKPTPEAEQISFSFTVSDWVDGGNLTLKESDEPTPSPSDSASLTYAEVAGTYKYNDPFTYTNAYGTWEICCYSDDSASTGFQLNSSSSTKTRLSYIGTPDFGALVTSVTITCIKEYSSDVYICSAGTENESDILLTVAGEGTTTTIDVSALGVSKLYVRSAKSMNVSSLSITTGEAAPAEDTPFTQTTVYGIYTGTDSAPVAKAGYDEFEDQLTYGALENGCQFAIMNFGAAAYWCNITLSSASFAVGSTYSAEGVVSGEEFSSDALQCVGKQSGKVWLEDKSGHIGLIIPIQ